MWFLNIFVKRIRSFTNITSTHFIQIVTSRRSSDFSPLGTKLYFHVSSLRKIYIVLTFNKAAFSRGCKPRITSYLIAGSIWPVAMPPQAYPWDLRVFLFLVVYSPSQSSWSTLYMCFGGTSFQEQNWFPSIFQNWCVEFDYSCIIHIKLALSYLLPVCA